MALQNVSPINDQLADIIVRATEPWIETAPGMAWTKVLWTGPESGRWVALYRWKKGYVAPAHKHLSAAHTYVLKGRLVDHLGECTAGNYVWRAAGSRHTAYCPDGAEFIVFFMKMPVRLPNPAASTAGSESAKAESGAR